MSPQARGAHRAGRTPLEYTLMCFVARAPATGGQLVRNLREFSVDGRGGSTGAVYPALRRLTNAGLLESKRRPPRESSLESFARAFRRGMGMPPARPDPAAPRGRVVDYRLTQIGIEELRRWAVQPVTSAQMFERPDQLLLRFTFLPGLAGVDPTRRFLRQYAEVADRMRNGIAEELLRFGEESSPTVRLAMELSLELATTRAEWALRAGRELTAATRQPMAQPRISGDAEAFEGGTTRDDER